MKKYRINQYVRMSNAQLRKNLGKVTLSLLAKGVSRSTLELFFLAVAEMTLRVKEGRMEVEREKEK